MRDPWSIRCVFDAHFSFQMVDIFCFPFLQLSSVAPPPLCRNVLPNGPNLSTLGGDSSPKSTVNPTIQAPRRKFVGEGKLRKVGSVVPPLFASLHKQITLYGIFAVYNYIYIYIDLIECPNLNYHVNFGYFFL